MDELDEPTIRATVPTALAGRRLDHVLTALVQDRSRAQLQRLVRRGWVRIDGRRVTRSNIRVDGQAKLLIHLSEPRSALPSPAPEPAVVYEDDELVVIDKPSGALIHPTRRLTGGTVSEWAEARFGPLPTDGGKRRPGIVHRLDRDTSGLMVVARTSASFLELKRQFRERTVDKRYLALVHGVAEERFTIERRVGPVPRERDLQMLDPRSEGRDSRTEFDLVERLGDFSLLQCAPRTGRRHQIRLHLMARGLQLVGEKLYRVRGALPLPASAPRLRRQALHARRLAFDHPATGARVEFEAREPGDMGKLLAWLRRARESEPPRRKPR